MEENHQIRLQNVKTILRTRFDGKKVRLAEAINRNPVTIQRWFSGEGKGRKIGDKMARLIEEKISLPPGWMDNLHEEFSDLEPNHQKKHFLKSAHGDTYDIPLRYIATLNQQYQLSVINKTKGSLMLLSTDRDAYAFQLIGHNPNPILSKNWGLVIEPGTPLAIDEYALIHMQSGEMLLRLITYQDDTKLMGLHPGSGEQQEFPRSQINKALYCYIGIPPSKISEEKADQAGG